MKQKLIALLADILKISIEDISDDLAMKEVETWDSLKHMELIVSIEKIFDIELTFDEIVAMQTVKGIKQVLINRGIEV
jgi:acyl carrier protein